MKHFSKLRSSDSCVILVCYSYLGKEGLSESENLAIDTINSTGGIDESVYTLELQQKYEESLRIIKQLRTRLVRRTEMISDIRSYYLRDIVAIKHILNEHLSENERFKVMQQYMEGLPSIDLKKALRLYGPHNSEMQVVPCDQCGGRIEVVLIDSPEVERLNKLLQVANEREQRFRGTLAGLDAQVSDLKREKQEESKVHSEEVSMTITNAQNSTIPCD